MIRYEGVFLSFDGKSVMADLDLTVNPGDKVVVTGKSGSGKSSLLRLALGFVRADSGRVLFAGEPVDDDTVWKVRRSVSYVDQNVSLGSGRVAEFIDFVSKLRANSGIDFGTEELFNLFDMDSGILGKDINSLSGGERQRLAIVVAVLLRRSVFFLDEITASLDKHLKRKVSDFFLEREDWTCLVVSHDPVWTTDRAVRVYDFEGKKWVQ